jgi:hypothetical protein
VKIVSIVANLCPYSGAICVLKIFVVIALPRLICLFIGEINRLVGTATTVMTVITVTTMHVMTMMTTMTVTTVRL